VACGEHGCGSVWYSPPHEPGTLGTAELLGTGCLRADHVGQGRAIGVPAERGRDAPVTTSHGANGGGHSTAGRGDGRGSGHPQLPVGKNGVIHGCYTTTGTNGSHGLVLQDVGTSCPAGDTAIQWNKQGPSTAGPSGLDVISVIASGSPAFCPPSNPYLIGGGGDTGGSGYLVTDSPLHASVYGPVGSAGGTVPAGSTSLAVSGTSAGSLQGGRTVTFDPNASNTETVTIASASRVGTSEIWDWTLDAPLAHSHNQGGVIQAPAWDAVSLQSEVTVWAFCSR
jgi:hypothetical protein